MQMNYEFPEATKTEGFRFGVETKDSETTAKHLLHPGVGLNEEQKVQDMYKMTHGSTLPGEQTKRKYDWPFNPNERAFGKPLNEKKEGAGDCLRSEINGGAFPMTKIVPASVEDFKNFSGEQLSKVKNLGQTGSLYDPGLVFGKNKKVDDHGVHDCIRGNDNFTTAYQDQKLGKTTKFGWRNKPLAGDENRSFGVPSIRADVQKPGQRSVANTMVFLGIKNQNFGDEPKALDLLFPHGYDHYGLSDDDIDLKRQKEEVNLKFNVKIRDIFRSIGIDYKAGKFEGVWMRALQLQNDTSCLKQEVSIKSFLTAVKEMHYIK